MIITILGTICGVDGWAEICEFGEAKLDWLKTFLELPHGIPSHDTFGRVFSLLDLVYAFLNLTAITIFLQTKIKNILIAL